MAKKQFFLGIDTETTITDKVVDFGAAVCDRQGNIVAQCAVMVQNVFGVDDLFYDRNNAGIWSQQSVTRRMDNYNAMLSAGSRMLASVNAINRWLEKVNGKYAPELFAYNLAFDRSKCQNTHIDISIFKNSFCLWGAAIGNICKTKPYRQFVLDNHLFNSPTELGNMTFSTTAEAVTGYLRGSMSDEPHTALEDLIGYEIPTLVHIAKKKNWREKITPYNWREFQVKDNFQSR